MSTALEMKPPNLAKRPEDLQYASRLLLCNLVGCTRTIVEYGELGPATKHSAGFSEELVREAAIHGKRILYVACNHHDGFEYTPEAAEKLI